MSIGYRSLSMGPHFGARIGLVGDGAADPMAGVARDATSLVYRPSTGAQWSQTLAAAGLSGSMLGTWLMQEASGNLIDVVDAQNLTVTGVLTYQQAATGWSTKVITIAGGTNKAIAPAGYADASAASVAWLGYLFMSVTPGGNRNVIVLSDSVANGVRIDHVATAKLVGVDVANTGTTASTYTGTALFPILFVVNRTAGACCYYTLSERIAITYNGTITDGTKGIGAVVATADASANWNYLACCTGATAEQFSTIGNARALYTQLGWVPTF